MAGDGRRRGPDAPERPQRSVGRNAGRLFCFAMQRARRRSAENRCLEMRCVEGPRGRSPSSAIQAIGETAVGPGCAIRIRRRSGKPGLHPNEAVPRRARPPRAVRQIVGISYEVATRADPGARSHGGVAIGLAGPLAPARAAARPVRGSRATASCPPIDAGVRVAPLRSRAPQFRPMPEPTRPVPPGGAPKDGPLGIPAARRDQFGRVGRKRKRPRRRGSDGSR